MEHDYFHTQAVRMARIHADYLLKLTLASASEATPAQAVELITDCMYFLDQPAIAIDVALGFHPIVEGWSAWAAWAAALDIVLESSSDVCPIGNRIRLCNARSQAARELGDFETAKAKARDALYLAERVDDQSCIAEALNKLGLIAFDQADLSDAQHYLERAYSLKDRQLPSLVLGHITMNLGLVAQHQARFAEAHSYFNEALMHYTSCADILHAAKVHCNIANLLQREGRLEEIPSILLNALNVFHSLGARHAYAQAENDLGYALLTLKQYQQAEQAFHRALDVFEELGTIGSKALVLSNVAELYVSTRQWGKAGHTLCLARELAQAVQKPLLIAAIDVDEGRMLYAQGDYHAARRFWDAALTVQTEKKAHAAIQHTRRLMETLPLVQPQQTKVAHPGVPPAN